MPYTARAHLPFAESMLRTYPLLLVTLLAPIVSAQTIQPPFNTAYSARSLGSAAGIPGSYGGVTFKWNDPSRLLVGGAANTVGAAIYEIAVTRDATGRITGFAGTASLHATAPNIDGGLAYGPNGVLFFSTYSNNNLGQIKLGSTAPDRIESLTGYGVAASTGTLNFVPPNFPGAGELKIASYNAGTFYGFTVQPDGNGTFQITAANGPVSIGGGPEGILYVPPGSALFPDYQRVLVCEFGTGTVAVYNIDAQGNPIPASRVAFLTGLSGVEGACTDPITGALLFSTFGGGGSQIVVVEGFGVCGSFQNYGSGIAGLQGVPTVQGGGCAGRGQFTSIDVANGRAGVNGLLAIGFAPQNQPLLNGSLLVQITTTFFHQLDQSGRWSLSLFLPTSPIWNGLNLYTQSFYVDPAGAQGISATPGLHIVVR